MKRIFNPATPLSLALQGGGAHGAFTWGVLDRLLEDGRFDIAAISGTSAGAINAVALAHGWLEGGRDGARAALQRLWQAVGASLPAHAVTAGPDDAPAFAPHARAWMQWARWWSPQQLNPFGLNPLREVLNTQIDFERLRGAQAPQLFIAATHANSGRLRLFGNAELSVDAVLASACLPSLQAAVVIDGEPYWDGGYSANPALFPLVRSGIPDLLIVWLSPLSYAQVPQDVEAIRERALEFAFNATFLREARLLSELCEMAQPAHWPLSALRWLGGLHAFGRLERRLLRLRTHVIDAHDDLAGLPQETRLMAHGPFLERLRDQGRERAARWLADAAPLVGRASSTDLGALFAPPAGPTARLAG